MRKFLSFVLVGIIITVLAACNAGDNENGQENNEELGFLEVDFDVPETAQAGDAVELKATVTYSDEPVEDADEVKFEIWLVDEEKDEEENMENSESIDATNNKDGTYTLDYTFEEVGDYEMYAHTTANDMHTMPKKKITITE